MITDDCNVTELIFPTNLFVHDTVKDEYERPLQAVQSGEDVSEDNRLRADVRQPERPGQAEQNLEDNRAFDPRPAYKATT